MDAVEHEDTSQIDREVEIDEDDGAVFEDPLQFAPWETIRT